MAPIAIAYRTADGGQSSRTFTTWRTHHGPIVREEGGKWIAIALMNTPVPALEQSFLRTKATDLADFMTVAELKANSSNNTLFADAKGEIAYLHRSSSPGGMTGSTTRSRSKGRTRRPTGRDCTHSPKRRI